MKLRMLQTAMLIVGVTAACAGVACAAGTKMQLATVPEPGTIVAALAILGPAGFWFRRKK